ncbi:MAG: hypothetical protein ACJ8CB_15075 [Ktedonobacteraceae bacterium]
MDNNIQVLPAEEDSIAITDLSSGLAFDEEMLRQLGYQVMIEQAESQHLLRADSILLEPTSGNTGVALVANMKVS